MTAEKQSGVFVPEVEEQRKRIREENERRSGLTAEEKLKELATYRGEPIKSLSKGELIAALKDMCNYYESRLADKDKIINLYHRPNS